MDNKFQWCLRFGFNSYLSSYLTLNVTS